MSSSAEHPLRICLWACPGPYSTALMYSFAQRDDVSVIDEPLAGHFRKAAGAAASGKGEELGSWEDRARIVIDEVILGACGKAVCFQKHLIQHLTKVDRSFLKRVCNVFLTWDPQELLPWLRRELDRSPKLRDAGLAAQSRLLSQLHQHGQDPPVLDVRELALDPPGVLEALCLRLGIGFQEEMLSWPPGGRPEDGPWAAEAYREVRSWSGFPPYREPDAEPFPDDLFDLHLDCAPHYRFLCQWAIKSPRSEAPDLEGEGSSEGSASSDSSARDPESASAEA